MLDLLYEVPLGSFEERIPLSEAPYRRGGDVLVMVLPFKGSWVLNIEYKAQGVDFLVPIEPTDFVLELQGRVALMTGIHTAKQFLHVSTPLGNVGLATDKKVFRRLTDFPHVQNRTTLFLAVRPSGGGPKPGAP